MGDRSAVLKIYNDRTTLLNKGFISKKELEEYINYKGVKISQTLLSAIINFSTVCGSIRPELLIESILQFLKGKRNFQRESMFISRVFKLEMSLAYEEFKEFFSENFKDSYESTEILRILQLVKRFGLDSEEKVTFDYVNSLIRTCQSSNYDMGRICNKLENGIKRTVIAKVFRDIYKFKPIIIRKPLEIISNTSFSIKSYEKKAKVDDKIKSQSLRNKLFCQAYKKFSVNYLEKLVKESFCIVRNPVKFRDPYVHRSIFKVYLKLKHKAAIILSKVLMKWNNIPESYIDFIKSGTIPCLISKENSVNFSKTINLIAITQEFKEKNYKMLGLLIEKMLKSPVKRVFLSVLATQKEEKTSGLRIFIKHMEKKIFQNTTLIWSKFQINCKISKIIENCEKKINYQAKRLKYSVPSKSKKIAVRVFIKLLTSHILKSHFQKYQTNTRFHSKKFSKSFAKTPKSSDFNTTAPTLSRSFVLPPKEFSPQLTTKYEDMRFSVKKIKYHHGFEKLWLIYRKLTKKCAESPCLISFATWKLYDIKRKPFMSLPTNKVQRAVNHRQFSFRDNFNNL